MIVSEALEKAGETVSRDREADRVVGMVGLEMLLVVARLDAVIETMKLNSSDSFFFFS